MSDELEPRETRRSRLQESLEQDDNEVITIDTGDGEGDGGGDKGTPEDKSAELAAAIKQRDEERDARLAAEQRAAEARAGQQGAAAAALQNRANSVESAIQSRQSIIENAEAALKAAQEANDAVAMSKATREIARAEAEIVNLEREKTWVATEQEKLKNAPPAAPVRQGPTAESQAWMDSHPRINVDPDYQARVAAADSSWRARGLPVGTKDYVKFIDDNLKAYYGRDDHGSIEAARPTQAKTPAAKKTPASSSAAPPDRGGSDDGGGGGVNASVTYKHAKGQVSLKRTSDGKETISGNIPPEWVAAAKWSGYTRGKPDGSGGKFKSDEEGAHAYAIEQLRAISERQQGRGEINYGEGVVLQ